jgi:hypothetical protein
VKYPCLQLAFPHAIADRKVTHYRTLVKKHLSDFAAFANRGRPNGIETDCVFDEARDQYLLLSLGWHQNRRVHITRLHARVCHGNLHRRRQPETQEALLIKRTMTTY